MTTCAFYFRRCMFSIWLFVARHCQNRMCGVFHHIDSQNNYVTPTMLLTNSGGAIIQIILSPLRNLLFETCVWIHISLSSLPHITGQLHIQMEGESDESSAILSPFKIPLSEWCHISLILHGRMVSSRLLTEDILT